MNEMFLLKLGEIVLKGLNRFTFENRLKSNLARRLRPYGKFRVYIIQSTLYVEPEAPDCDLDGAWEACGAVFGVVSMSRCRPCEKNLDAVFQAVMDYLGDDLAAAKSFKVESKRSDKSFPMTSIQISQEIGGRLAEAFPELEVDVHHPEYTVYVELRDRSGYVHGPAQRGAGGLPTGVGGRAAVLLSGGIDSPVAAYMMAKRGRGAGVHPLLHPIPTPPSRPRRRCWSWRGWSAATAAACPCRWWASPKCRRPSATSAPRSSSRSSCAAS